MSALVVAGLVATGSTADTADESSVPRAQEALLAASGATGTGNSADTDGDTQPSRTVGLLSVIPESPRKLTAMTPPADGSAPFAGAIPLRDIALPATGGALGIPEIVLAAYRNAELALASAMPNCGLPWNLLAGIGRIESGHAGGGRTDAAGTTVTPIFGPALDGTLPGNEVIKANDGGYVRAVGPMQFLPSTWSHYASDGNGDGVADPHNVFDATVAAGKYLCSGGLNLRDPAQELRAVLRYNNSMSYAANVLSWSAAYRTGGTPSQVGISPELIPPGQAPVQTGPDVLAVGTVAPTQQSRPAQQPPSNAVSTFAPTPTTQAPAMINIPGLPPIPCGIFCPPPPPAPADPCLVQAAPAPMPKPGEPARPPVATQREYGADDPARPEAAHQPAPVCTPQPNAAEQQVPAPQPPKAEQQPEVTVTPDPEPPAAETAPEQPAPPTQQPGITLPFNIVIPLPPAP
ncbi:lytic murein transglycosylase [Nocardia arizonensis]|uniref:lytic murein transglycosylase n=1 Tax=Nocardia arizonensis TaxID=1141647 RepID=UPI003B84807C